MQVYTKIVCPCSPDAPMELVQIGGLVYEKCMKNACVNKFPYDNVIKIEEKLGKYYEEKNTFDGFVHYFRVKESQFRARAIEYNIADSDTMLVTVEVTNLTKQPQFKGNNNRKVDPKVSNCVL